MESLIKAASDSAWGSGMLILLVGAGVGLTLLVRGLQFRELFPSLYLALIKRRGGGAGRMGNMFATKSMTQLLSEAAETGTHSMERTLGSTNLILLGIGAIIGAGLFVRTATAVANNAGPSVTISFIIAGLACVLTGLCYAELASMIPIAGSAYTYSYATLGQFVAWIIGWDLVLEYALGAATVAIAWSEYFNRLLVLCGISIPFQWCHSPFETLKDNSGTVLAHGILNVPALFIVLALTLLLIRSIKESALVNAVIVIAKVAIVVLIIVLGWHFIDPANHTPYIPSDITYVDSQGGSHHYGGIIGIFAAAGVVFFAFIGFDAVSTASQEVKNPRKDMPIGILGSLAVCTILYILFAHVLTGIAPVSFFRETGKEASIAAAIAKYMPGFHWLANWITVAILAGFSSGILVMLMGQSRVFYSMSRDGLVPKMFSDLHPKFRTPYKSNLLFCLFVGLFASLIPVDIVGDMTSIGTLFAFVLVSVGVIVMRRSNPDAERAFRTPMVPLVPILGIAICLAMIYSLGWENWLRLGVWLIIGLFIYFGYSVKHATLRTDKANQRK